MPQVAKAMFALRRQGTGSGLPAARAAARGGDLLRAARARAAHGLEPGGPGHRRRRSCCSASSMASRSTPRIWCPGTAAGFDLPVLHYRGAQCRRAGGALLGDRRRRTASFRYNNYLSRYHWRHLDLMDVLSRISGRARAPRWPTWRRCWDFPGKLGFYGSQVWEAYLAGDLARIRALLRDRRAEHLAHLSALRAAARGALARGAPGGARAREGLPARGARAAPRRVPARLGVGRLSRSARRARAPAAEETGTVAA